MVNTLIVSTVRRLNAQRLRCCCGSFNSTQHNIEMKIPTMRNSGWVAGVLCETFSTQFSSFYGSSNAQRQVHFVAKQQQKCKIKGTKKKKKTGQRTHKKASKEQSKHHQTDQQQQQEQQQQENAAATTYSIVVYSLDIAQKLATKTQQNADAVTVSFLVKPRQSLRQQKRCCNSI